MNSQWSRSVDGVLAGVCKSLSRRFSLDVMLVRLAWLFAVLFFGVGLVAYIVLAVGLPREDRLSQAHKAKIMGVCSRLALRFDLDVGLTRAGVLALFLGSVGTVFLIYLVLYFVLPKESELLSKKEILK